MYPCLLFSQIETVVAGWKENTSLKNASISYCVIDNATGKIISAMNEHTALIPASTLKVISTSAALAILGGNYKYETKLFYNGEFDKSTGILNGDLIVQGSGDPSLQSENFYKEDNTLINEWVQELKKTGLKKINGKIIGDASAYSRKIPDNWIWEDICNYYGAVPNGLSYADNKCKINYTSGNKGSIANINFIQPNYNSKPIQIISTVKAGVNKDDAYAYGDPFSFTREIHGTIPANKKTYEIEIALPDPALLCAEKLCEALIQSGISCDNKMVYSGYIPIEKKEQLQLIHTHYSPSLDKIIYYTNQTSNNHYCESILYTLGGGSAEKGILKIKSYWSKQGLDTNEIYIEDASGLGRINTITTHFQAMALHKVFSNKNNYLILINSLPLAGNQGSMKNMGKGTFIEGKLRAKTGYMTRVRAYSGYTLSKSGKNLSYALIFNNYTCSATEAKIAMEKFLIALAEL